MSSFFVVLRAKKIIKVSQCFTELLKNNTGTVFLRRSANVLMHHCSYLAYVNGALKMINIMLIANIILHYLTWTNIYNLQSTIIVWSTQLARYGKVHPPCFVLILTVTSDLVLDDTQYYAHNTRTGRYPHVLVLMTVFGCSWLRVLDLAIGVRAVGLKAAFRMSRAKQCFFRQLLDFAVAASSQKWKYKYFFGIY